MAGLLPFNSIDFPKKTNNQQLTDTHGSLKATYALKLSAKEKAEEKEKEKEEKKKH